jgi:hypothetical protein
MSKVQNPTPSSNNISSPLLVKVEVDHITFSLDIMFTGVKSFFQIWEGIIGQGKQASKMRRGEADEEGKW